MLNDVQNLTINELKVKAQQIAEARDVSLTELPAKVQQLMNITSLSVDELQAKSRKRFSGRRFVLWQGD
ncbi:MAG: hypothetical protein EZS28_031818, partial [Streblomastix strix]